MKRNIHLFITVIFLLIATSAFSQIASRRDLMRQRKPQRAKVKRNAIKKAKQEVRKFRKDEGWSQEPGERPLEKMIEESCNKQLEMKKNADGAESNAYIWTSANKVANNRTKAHLEAIDAAKKEMKSKIEAKVVEIASSNIDAAQFSNVDAETKEEIIQLAKVEVNAKLAGLKPVVYATRREIPKRSIKRFNLQQLKPGTIETKVILFYDLYQADILVRESMKSVLNEKLKDNQSDLEKLKKI